MQFGIAPAIQSRIGTTLIHDLSGHRRDFAQVGLEPADWQVGEKGYAIRFDGTSAEYLEDADGEDYVNGPYDGEIQICRCCGGSGEAKNCCYW